MPPGIFRISVRIISRMSNFGAEDIPREDGIFGGGERKDLGGNIEFMAG